MNTCNKFQNCLNTHNVVETLFSDKSPLTIQQSSHIFSKETIPLTTFTKFKALLTDVEEAFTITSKRIKFMTLINLCEGIINYILKLQNIPLHHFQEERKIWMNFKEKLECFIKINTRCPLSNIPLTSLVNDLYQQKRNLVMHGDPDVQIEEEHINGLKSMAATLITYDLDKVSFVEQYAI